MFFHTDWTGDRDRIDEIQISVSPDDVQEEGRKEVHESVPGSQRKVWVRPASAGPCLPMTDGPAKPDGSAMPCGGQNEEAEARQIQPILNLTMTHPSSLESMCPLRLSKKPFR